MQRHEPSPVIKKNTIISHTEGKKQQGAEGVLRNTAGRVGPYPCYRWLKTLWRGAGGGWHRRERTPSVRPSSRSAWAHCREREREGSQGEKHGPRVRRHCAVLPGGRGEPDLLVWSLFVDHVGAVVPAHLDGQHATLSIDK